MRIIELRAENFKRLRAVSIRPGSNVQQITGRNAQGKSSVLDAIAAALGGKDASPPRPVREGTQRAKVVVDLGDLIVTRKWSADGRSSLVVESKDGASHRSPQKMLDELLGQLTFDPLAFVRAPAKEQAATLRRVAGYDTATLDGKRKAAYDRRTEANRILKLEQAKLEGMPMVEAPDQPVSITALLEQIAAAEGKERQAQARHSRIGEIDREFDRIAKDITDAELKIERLKAERENLGGEKANLLQEIGKAGETPNVAALRAEVGQAETTNAKVRQKQARAAQIQVVKKAGEEAEVHEKAIAELDDQKAKLLAEAKFPVPGLSVDETGPTFNGIPLEQASGAEQLRVGLAVAAALNPTLRTILVRDGSLLDPDGMALVAEWAEQHDAQVLIERVADGSGVGIVIEDGMVVGNHLDVTPADVANEDAPAQEGEDFPVGGA